MLASFGFGLVDMPTDQAGVCTKGSGPIVLRSAVFSETSPMHSTGVPFRDGEHSVNGDKAVAFAAGSPETRYLGSLAPA